MTRPSTCRQLRPGPTPTSPVPATRPTASTSTTSAASLTTNWPTPSPTPAIPSGLATSVAALTADLKKQLDKAVSQSGTDPFGFGFPWATYDTTSHGAGLAVMAREYDHLTGTSTYAAFADRWLANILGANAWGLSLIVGDGTTFPHCLQHQVANLVGSLNGGTAVLAGAAVEGPNSSATHGLVTGMIACPTNGVDVYAPFNGSGAEFKDDMQSYSNTEPAVDLTATSPLAFAWQISGA